MSERLLDQELVREFFPEIDTIAEKLGIYSQDLVNTIYWRTKLALVDRDWNEISTEPEIAHPDREKLILAIHLRENVELVNREMIQRVVYRPAKTGKREEYLEMARQYNETVLNFQNALLLPAKAVVVAFLRTEIKPESYPLLNRMHSEMDVKLPRKQFDSETWELDEILNIKREFAKLRLETGSDFDYLLLRYALEILEVESSLEIARNSFFGEVSTLTKAEAAKIGEPIRNINYRHANFHDYLCRRMSEGVDTALYDYLKVVI